MNKHLYFICPTDYLEVIINNTFDKESYFCTALGNTIAFNNKTIEYIKGLLESERIRAITFILSDDNEIISNALYHRDLPKINRLENLYDTIKYQKNRISLLTRKKDILPLFVSFHLNLKINELKKSLKETWFLNEIQIDAKVYNRKTQKFFHLESNNFKRECFYLN